MSSKSILKKFDTSKVIEANNIDETHIVLKNDKDIQQDGGGIKDSKKLQIKKKEFISASKPSLKINKKKVSIIEEQKEDKKDDHVQTEDKKDAHDQTEDKKDAQSQYKHKEILVDISKALKVIKNTTKKKDISEIFNDDDVDYRYIITNYDFSKNKTPPKITRYEKALLVGKRATQIEKGANPNIKVLPGQTSIDIAEEELRQRKIPFIIKRPIGNKFEFWKPIDMEVIMD